MNNFLIFLIVVLPTIYILKNVVFKKKNSNHNIFKFKKVHNKEYKPVLEDVLNFWNKPNSNEVHLFAHGSIGGNGRLGITNNKRLANIAKSKNYNAKIINISISYITVEIIPK